jgi:hypothetical protein
MTISTLMLCRWRVPDCDIVLTERHRCHALHSEGCPQRLDATVIASPDELTGLLQTPGRAPGAIADGRLSRDGVAPDRRSGSCANPHHRPVSRRVAGVEDVPLAVELGDGLHC